MERSSQGESILLGYSVQRSLVNSGSSAKSPSRNSDEDFHDVFGGPPRRFSMQEVRYSLCDANVSHESKGNEEPWSGSGEKPVFGDEGLNRRRFTSSDFYDDIFGGDTSVSSTPKKHGREYPFPSSPGSGFLSPLPPKAEPSGGSSLLSQFSLPPKMSKGVELPTFGSPARSPCRFRDGASNGISHYYSPGTSLTRFSSEAIQISEGSRNDVQSSYRQSLLALELPLSNEVSSSLIESDKSNGGTNLKKDSESSDNSSNSGHFHFSIYKWASKGVPLNIPLRGRSSSRSKEMAKSDEPLSGTGERISQSSKTPLPDSSSNGHTFLYAQFTKSENSKEENNSTLDEITADKVKPSKTAEERRSFQSLMEDVPEKGISECKEEAHKPEKKPFCSLLFDNDLERDAGSVERAKTGGEKESKPKSTIPSSPSSQVVGNSKTLKKQERKPTSLLSSEVDKASYQGSPWNSRETNGRSRVKGRVKEFVKMFNQGTPSKPKDGSSFRSRSCKWDEKCIFEHETTTSTARTDEKLQVPEVSDDLKELRKAYPSGQGIPATSTGSFQGVSKAAVEETDDSSHENFQVKELPQDENVKLNQEIQDIDAKIRQWTKGKEGNIRSLLSTLQYVLWPGSGWKPVPLVDIIEGNAVKRAYQRALLCLHPDKLQQKGAASHQKYIAEKVFDILQEAWTYFNSLGSV